MCSSDLNGQLVLPGGRQPITSQINLAAAVAMVRPEQIRLVEAAGAGLTGVIDSVAFNGEKQRVVVSGASDKPLTVDAPNLAQIKPGDQVGLSIAPEAVRLLPPED